MAIVSGSCARVNGSRNGPSVSATPAGTAAGQSQPMIAVWEWQDDLGFWRPYSGQVSAHIERSLAPRGQRGGGPGATSICLGQSDPSLSPYLIDIPSLKQFRQDTDVFLIFSPILVAAKKDSVGSSVPVRSVLGPRQRRLLGMAERRRRLDPVRDSDLHPAGAQLSYQARQGTADLGPHGYNYIVDLTSLAQVNKSTGFRRQPEPAQPSGDDGPGRGGSPGLRVLYSPYPRRPLSVGGMSWGSPWPPPSSGGGQLSAPLLTSSASANGLSVPSIPVQLNGSTSVSSALAGMASILMSAVGLGVHFTTAPLPQQQPQQQQPQQPAPFSLPPPLLPPASRPSKPPSSSSSSSSSVRRAKRQHRRASSQRPEEVIQRYMEVVAGVPDEDCIICMDQLSNPSGYETPSTEEGGPSILPDTVGKFIKCGHTLHMLCMLAMYNNGTKDGSLQCPSCKTIYGEKTGTQPKGKMEIYSIAQSLPGHPDCGTIQIIYSIPPGIQGPEHPNPGQPYTCRGFPRFCFLPDNDKGRKVLELLKVAWMRRLIFTVGTSSTTGEPDTVVWNGIHHKTEMMSNLSGHGYPDPNYLDNVLSELASQGVTEDCLKPPGGGGGGSSS
ncbi:hypothetical protein L3Q82_006612 [Scortum barcoo]|uniref:Uncharacterized protein n=1 Tax=Scortum barcoo TaxID=214431 RepID=A0ACB8X2Y3_9TELE|nr:hypothetical protein L3Q82_006612 [Scortum barcoo]